MNEIKFKIWDKIKKEWAVVGEEILTEIPSFYVEGNIGVLKLSQTRYELVQYISLKDKNKKEIYKGDFVRRSANGNEPRQIYQVVWLEDELRFALKENDGALFYGCDDDDNKFFQWERVSNVYENPELLKQKYE